MFNIDLSNKTALVCGSSGGIGLASAQILASLNARVILLARNENKLQHALLTLPPNNHKYIVTDLSKQTDIENLIAQLQEEKIDILINNAGGPAQSLAKDVKPDEYIKTFNTHVIASSVITQQVINSMIEKKWGRIINIISVGAKAPIPNLAVSNTIRGAMLNWSKSLSYEVAKYGITVNNVLPGFTQTIRFEELSVLKAKDQSISLEEMQQKLAAMVPMNRIGSAEEVASAVVFFASPASSYITGTSLCADGGMSSWS